MLLQAVKGNDDVVRARLKGSSADSFTHAAFCPIALYSMSYLSSCDDTDPRELLIRLGLEDKQRAAPRPDSDSIHPGECTGWERHEPLPRQRAPGGPSSDGALPSHDLHGCACATGIRVCVYDDACLVGTYVSCLR